MTFWKPVSLNGVTFTRCIKLWTLDGGASFISGIPEMADLLKKSRNRYKYGR